MPAAAPSLAPAPRDVSALAAELADLAGRLAGVLAHESALVRAMRIKEIAPLQAEKTDLTARYQKAFKSLGAAANGKPLPAALKQRLAAAAERLAKAVIENELMLRVGRAATERLIGSIVSAVKAQKKASAPYAPHQRAAQRRAFITAAAIDRRL